MLSDVRETSAVRSAPAGASDSRNIYSRQEDWSGVHNAGKKRGRNNDLFSGCHIQAVMCWGYLFRFDVSAP